MRKPSFAFLAIWTALLATPAVAEQLAPPKPYKTVAVTPPQPLNDKSFDAFRQQLSDVAEKKDRAALARIIAQGFFWIPEDHDVADKSKSGIDNLAKIMGLDAPNGQGWEALGSFATELTADPIPDPARKGVICAPGEPTFDEKAAEELAAETQTVASEWNYPATDGVEVRSGPQTDSPVISRLGLYLVRAYPDDTPANAVFGGDTVRIVTPEGKLGYMPVDLLLPLATDQLCYVKSGNAWKIAGVIGGGPPGQ